MKQLPSLSMITWAFKKKRMAADPHYPGSPFAQRFSDMVVAAMQKKKILGVTSRYVIVLK